MNSEHQLQAFKNMLENNGIPSDTIINSPGFQSLNINTTYNVSLSTTYEDKDKYYIQHSKIVFTPEL